MGGTIFHLEPDGHIAVQKLLPWYVSGRLEADEVAEVDDHLAGCDACRAELETERRLQQQGLLVNADDAAARDSTEVGAGWSAMQMRIAGADAAATAPRLSHGLAASTLSQPSPSRDRQRAWHGGWWKPSPATRARALPAVLSVALGVALGFTLFSGAEPRDEFRALAAPPVDGANALVRFRPDASEAQIRRSLNDSAARLVDGPTVTDAYVVRLPRDGYVTSLGALRRSPAVVLVEALEPAAKP